MLKQFKEALAAKPTCIVIMGHPGNDAFADLVRHAVEPGHRRHRRQLAADRAAEEVRPAGLRLCRRRSLRGRHADRAEDDRCGALKSGDKALVYGVFSQAERGQSDQGLDDTLEKAGLKVDHLEISPEANHDASLAVPVLAAYIQSHPD